MADQVDSTQLKELNVSNSQRDSQSMVTQTDGQYKSQEDPHGQNQQQLTTRANMEPSATVKFTLLPMKQVVTFALSLKMSIKDVKEQFSAELKTNPKFIKFFSENDGKLTRCTTKIL
jgi:hypothetical protein